MDSGLTVGNTDGQDLVSATVAIGGVLNGDVLAFNGGASSETFSDGSTIHATHVPTSGVLTLSGTASATDYQTAFDSVTFSSTSSVGSRTVSWTTNDDLLAGNTATSNVKLASAGPTLSTGGTVTFTGGGSAVVLDSTAAITDPKSGSWVIG
ncbi:MAG TPA: hypothetical protein VK726_15290 [Acetobacteraceae bacterium]|nr:hypothetical protein [Acetobacteraceae bacterium]